MARLQRPVVQETVDTSVEQAAARPSDSEEGLWAIAMLRIAFELKRPNAPEIDEIVDGVVARMGIPKDRFERYLAEHLGPLKEAAARRG